MQKFSLNYAGKQSLFEGKTIPPAGMDEPKLQILAIDQVGNSGQHIIPFRIFQ